VCGPLKAALVMIALEFELSDKHYFEGLASLR
jgi:hypothetical protein